MWWLPLALADDPEVLRRGLMDPTGWEEIDRARVDDVGEVVVRHKAIGGQDCLEGSTSSVVSPDLMLQIATEIEAQPRWSSWDVVAATRLSAGQGSFDYYQVLDNPTPIADRVWFLRATVSRRGEDRLFAWEQIDGAAAWPTAWADVNTRFPGVVPTTVNVGHWIFSPLGSATRVVYRICTDGGGSIPRWVGERAARATLPTNVADLVREANRRAAL